MVTETMTPAAEAETVPQAEPVLDHSAELKAKQSAARQAAKAAIRPQDRPALASTKVGRAILAAVDAPKAKRAPRLHVDPATGATVLDPKPTKAPKAPKAQKAKAEPKPKQAKAERVPAEAFMAEVTRLHLTKSQAAQALGVSTSSVSEYSGFGRKNLLAKPRWADAKARLAAFAKGLR